MHELTTVETVHDEGSWLFTVRDQYGERDEVILVPCEDGVEHGSTSGQATLDDSVEAWINRCTHEAQRFDTGRGVPMREGQIICPKHGSMFDSCSGYCDNGEAVDTTLPSVDISVRNDGRIVLTDDEFTFVGEGGIDDNEGDGDDDPTSTSHIGF
ncbi:Rieske (2Fe-2S) iron-sulphur domain protein [Haloterrigena turkmenica DSM 5511]|uniref:Rieske (2Fe-2S) iron-sulphur domain protein n=1 Tax=Haloterrigena turkmenica (strain ATCC 51198 / DSM 5511 / JCM 9101 / NCIMB 13204 / VKM B-1734 / 4k) TaxID=543526 RepID=D2RX99_HALTV|nr:Rieske 2Fe-2S domain-containing protein [Haloterrigena turkmenica]ADB61623.1 Rieske (2Fe-2S) iron-sulphur domain protein [Haloterrigena turkmenica DSM 5511]